MVVCNVVLRQKAFCCIVSASLACAMETCHTWASHQTTFMITGIMITGPQIFR